MPKKNLRGFCAVYVERGFCAVYDLRDKYVQGVYWVKR